MVFVHVAVVVLAFVVKTNIAVDDILLPQLKLDEAILELREALAEYALPWPDEAVEIARGRLTGNHGAGKPPKKFYRR